MATTDSATPKAGPDDQLIPVGDGIDDSDLRLLSQVRLESFTAQPSTITPFGTGSTLRWRVTTPSPVVVISTEGRPVDASGTMVVAPPTTTSYRISARAGRVTKPLGAVSVRVDTSACLSTTIPESAIRTRVRQVLDQLDQAANEFKQRSPAVVEVDAQGIRIGFRAELAVPDLPDPNVNIDMVLGLRVRDGAAEAYYKSFAVDVDWPWWVTVITAGAAQVLEEYLDGRVERTMKPLLLTIVQQQLDAYVAQLPGRLRLHTIVPQQDAVAVTACPAGANAPFMVVG